METPIDYERTGGIEHMENIDRLWEKWGIEHMENTDRL